MRVAKRAPNIGSGEHSQTIQHAKRMKTGERVGTFGRELRERCGGGFIRAPEQHHVRFVALPFVGRIERGDQLARTQLVETRQLTRMGAGREHAVDAALVLAQPIVRKQFRTAVGGQPVRVLDHVAVNVHDPESAVGTGARHDRAAPAIFAGEKVRALLSARTPCGEGHAVLRDDIALNEIVKRLAREGVHFVARTR